MALAGCYYNEKDAFAANWLRNLIMLDLIAPGDVDERSIEDVSPDDLRGYAQHHFFAGIGVWSAALRGAGWPDDRPVWTGSCPCQPFSTAGQGKGFADERHLWPAWHWLIREHRPDVVLGEQVASRPGLDWFDLVSADLEAEDYAVAAVDLCAAGLGAPHIRQRLFFVAHHHQRRLEFGRPRLQRPDLHDAHRRSAASGQLADASSSSRSRRDTGAVPGAQADGRCERGEAGRVPDIALADGAMVDAAGEQARLSRCAREPGSTLADPDGGDAGTEGLQRGRQHGQQQAHGLASQLGHPQRDGLRERGWSAANEPHQPGHWSLCDWIPCRDGKWRPVEPGTFPLAHGAPARVGRLRGYGNALVKPVAEAFIVAAMAAMP